MSNFDRMQRKLPYFLELCAISRGYAPVISHAWQPASQNEIWQNYKNVLW